MANEKALRGLVTTQGKSGSTKSNFAESSFHDGFSVSLNAWRFSTFISTFFDSTFHGRVAAVRNIRFVSRASGGGASTSNETCTQEKEQRACNNGC